MRRGTTGPALGLLLVVLAIGWAGLRPFALLPPNRATRVEGEGLRFEAGGMALSRGEVAWDTSTGPARFALELELDAVESADAASRDLLVLVDEVRVPAFRLRQQGADLVVADRVTNPDGERWYNERRATGVFAGGGRRRIRLVGGEDLEIQVDGRTAGTAGGYPIPVGRAGERLAGRVLLGTGPDGRTPWTGSLLALRLADGEKTLARYAFGEGEGRRVRSHADPGLDLDVPPHFRSLRPPLAPVSAGARDVLVNLLGFVPFGYLLGVLLRGRGRALGLVVLAGLGLSLTIELLQSLTVTRMSSVVDLALNAVGALAGGALSLRGGR